MAKKFLVENNIEFEDKDVSSNENAKHEMIEISGSLSVPVIVIDGEVIVGWNQPKLKKALGLVG